MLKMGRSQSMHVTARDNKVQKWKGHFQQPIYLILMMEKYLSHWTQILIGKVIFLGYYFSLFFIRVKLFQAAQMEYAF